MSPACCVQEQYEKALAALQHRMDELESKLKGVQLVLQEKVQQLKEQVKICCLTFILRNYTRSCPHTFVSSADGEEHKVQRAAEGSVRGELAADEGAAGH